MKKHFIHRVGRLLVLSFGIMSGLCTFAQSTEGTDFWFTMMRADSDDPEKLSVTISAKEAAIVELSNFLYDPANPYCDTIQLAAMPCMFVLSMVPIFQ